MHRPPRHLPTIVCTFLTLLTGMLTSSIAHTQPPQTRPMVVEMFTSTLCPSCPAGHAMLAKLARERSDILPLTLHVNLWDKSGRTDPFAFPAASGRHSGYHKRFDLSRIYTPQAVVDGADETIAGWGWRVNMLLSNTAKTARTVPAHLAAGPDGLIQLKLAAAQLPRPADIWLFTYTPGVQPGRNNVPEVNLVRAIHHAGTWDGQAKKLVIQAPRGDGEAIAAVVQLANLGPVVAVARLGRRQGGG